MINTHKRERLEAEIQEALREHSRAQNTLNSLKLKVAELALAGESVNEDLAEKIRDAEWKIHYWPERLEEIKSEYISMIQQIRLF